jgi:hypothetical protein
LISAKTGPKKSHASVPLRSTFDTLVIFSSLYNWTINCYFSAQVPELGDTLFIVFRKQQLIFLHWYVSSTSVFKETDGIYTHRRTQKELIDVLGRI